MSIENIIISGLRGFDSKEKISFAVPDNINEGSGLTVMIGPNNSGKSTLIEAIHLLSTNKNFIPVEARNTNTGENVYIEAQDVNGNKYIIESTEHGGAFIQRKFNDIIQESWNNKLNTYILTSKRGFSSTFNNTGSYNRDNYKGNVGNDEYRNENNINHNFGGRLLNIYKNKQIFNNCLEKVLLPIPNWTIESINGGNLYLQFSFDNVKHSSNGAGDGFINIFNIIDSLYDSAESNVILIDEPEISLHPDLQKKLFKLLVEYSKNKQIIISTHSPYFVDWNIFSNYGKIIRFVKENDSIKTYELSENTKTEIKSILSDANNPHILSLDANEIFFLNDNVIVTEGQDDVICYKEIFKKYKFNYNASFFGWGAGGAVKISIILDILSELGYKNVFTIIDNDKRDIIPELQVLFPLYSFYAIAANDVRNKSDDKMNKAIEYIKTIDFDYDIKNNIIAFLEENAINIEGLVIDRKKYEINEKYKNDVDILIEKIKSYFGRITNDRELKNDCENIEKVEKISLEEEKARNIFDKYLKDNKIYESIQKKYSYLSFRCGDGDILGISKIKKDIFYAIVFIYESVSEEYGIKINLHYTINIKTGKVKLIKRKIISNTLPKKYKF